MKAAETIVAAAVPLEAKTVAERTIPGADFRDSDWKPGGLRVSYYKPTKQKYTFKVRNDGSYRLGVDLNSFGQFEFDPGRCHVDFKVDDEALLKQEYGWDENKKFRYEFDVKRSAGEHELTFEMGPLVDATERRNSLDLQLVDVRLDGPLEDAFRVRTKNYDRFFSKDAPPNRPTSDGPMRAKFSAASPKGISPAGRR